MADPIGTQNLSIFQGIVSFMQDGEATFRDLGEVPEFTLQPNVEKKEYQSSRSGMRGKVREVVTTVGGTISLQMDEMTRDNLALFFFGTLDADRIKVLSVTEKVGMIKIVGTGQVGKRLSYTGRVSLSPSDSIAFLTGGEWASAKLSGELLQDTSYDPAYPWGAVEVVDESA